MSQYEFKIINNDDQLKAVWDKGIFLENHITKAEKINCYAIDMFFVEVVYYAKRIRELKLDAFKKGIDQISIHLILKLKFN